MSEIEKVARLRSGALRQWLARRRAIFTALPKPEQNTSYRVFSPDNATVDVVNLLRTNPAPGRIAHTARTATLPKSC